MEIHMLPFVPSLYPNIMAKSVLSFSIAIRMEYKKMDDTF